MLEFGKWLTDSSKYHYYYMLYETTAELVGLWYTPVGNRTRLEHFVRNRGVWLELTRVKQVPGLTHRIPDQKIGVIEDMFKEK